MIRLLLLKVEGAASAIGPEFDPARKFGNGALNVFAILAAEWAHSTLDNRAAD